MRGSPAYNCIAFALLLTSQACTGVGVGADPEATGTTAADLRIEANRHALAYDYGHRDNMPHGIAGDERVVFVTEPLNGHVAVLDRITSQQIGELPAPPGGWLLPFSARLARTGRVVVLDPGGFPSPTAPAIPRLYDYEYQVNPSTHAFTATLVRTVRFDALPVVFSEDFEIADDGTYIVSESIIGALWLVAPDGTISPGLLPSSFAPGAGIPALAPCAFNGTTINGVPFTTAGNFGPGVGALAWHGGNVYFGSSCTGGVSRVPFASLRDPTRSPEQRAADIQPVSPRPAGTVESLHALTFNRYDPSDDRLYAGDSFNLRLLRINTHTGAREVLADDSVLFNFPVAVQFLPPVLGLQPLVVASDQEYRFAALNPAISEDMFQLPFRLTKVYVLH